MANEFNQDFSLLGANVTKANNALNELIDALAEVQRQGKAINIANQFNDLLTIVERITRDLDKLDANKDFVNVASITRTNDKLEDTEKTINNITNALQELTNTGDIGDIGSLDKNIKALASAQSSIEQTASKANIENIQQQARAAQQAADEQTRIAQQAANEQVRIEQEAAEKRAEAIDKLNKSAARVTDGINQIGTASFQLGQQATEVLKLGEAFNKVKEIINEVATYAKQLEDIQVQFEVKIKDAEKTQQFIQELRDFAIDTPLMLTDVTNAANLLSNYGIALDEVIGRVKQIGDLSRGQSDVMNRIALAVGQVASKGRLYAEETRQLTEAGVPLRKALQDTLDISGAELDKMFKRGQVTIEMFWDAFDKLTQAGGQFNGVLDAMSGTTSGLEAKLKDMLLSLGTDLGATGLEEYRDLLKDIIEAIDEFKGTDDFKEIQEVIGDIAAEGFDAVREIMNDLLNNSEKVINIIEKIRDIIVWIANNPLKAYTIVMLPTIIGMVSNILSIGNGIYKVTTGIAGVITTINSTQGLASTVPLVQKISTLVTKIGTSFGSWGPLLATAAVGVAGVGAVIDDVKTKLDLLEQSQKDYNKPGQAISESFSLMSPIGRAVEPEFEIQVKKDLALLADTRSKLDKEAAEYDKTLEELNEILYKESTGELSSSDIYRKSQLETELENSRSEIDRLKEDLVGFYDVLDTESKNGVVFIDYLKKYDNDALTVLQSLLLNVGETSRQREKLLGETINELIESGASSDEIVKQILESNKTANDSFGAIVSDEVTDASKRVLKAAVDKIINNKGVYKTFGEEAAETAAQEFLNSFKEKLTSDLTSNLPNINNPTIPLIINPNVPIVDNSKIVKTPGFDTLGGVSTDSVKKNIEDYGDFIEDITGEEAERIKEYISNLQEAILQPSGDNREIINIFGDQEKLIEDYIDKQEKLRESFVGVRNTVSEDSDVYEELSVAISMIDNNIQSASTQLDRGKEAIQTYASAVKELASNLKDSSIALADFSDEAVGTTQLGVLEGLGYKQGQLLNNIDKIRIAEESLFAPFNPSSEQMNNLSKSIDTFGNKLLKSGLSGAKLEQKAYSGLYDIINNFFKSSDFEYDAVDIAGIVSQLYSGVFENYISAAADATEAAIERAQEAAEKAQQERENLYSSKMAEYNYQVEMGILDTLESQLERLKQIKEYAYSIEDIRQSDLDILNKQKEILNEQLTSAQTLYDINKASRDAMNDYSQAWIDHNVYIKAIDEMGELAGYQRVFDRKQADLADQILQKQKQIALVRQNSSMSELEKMQEIASINDEIRSMNAEIMRNQDEIAKKREEVYKNTLYDEIQKLYDYELERINEVVKAREQEKEDKSYEERKRELEEEIQLYSTSVSKEGRQKLDELRKELQTLEEEYNDTLFNRQIEEEKEKLEERKEAEEKAADEAAFNFGQKYGEALNNELDAGLEKVRTSFNSGALSFTDSISSYFKTSFVQDLVNGINQAFRGVNSLISGSNTNITDNRSQTNNFYNTTYSQNYDSTSLFFNTAKSYGKK